MKASLILAYFLLIYLDQNSYISTVDNRDLLAVDASITGGIPFLFPGVSASVTGHFEMDDRSKVRANYVKCSLFYILLCRT